MVRKAVITGAFSYTGASAARELSARGWQVHTLTNRNRPAASSPITSAPLNFDLAHLVRELQGADVFVNTFWVRLPHAGQTFATAVEQSKLLVEAAKQAGVRRIVHVSVSNASLDSKLGYYHGKALVDEAVRGCGLPHTIVRPTLVVGPNDVLTANIAWFLRQFPLFPVPGGGNYKLQPVTLDDTGRILADAAEASGDGDVDAAGPDTMTFREYVAMVARACGVSPWIFGAPSWLSLGALRVIEPLIGDVILTQEELAGLEQELLVSHRAPTGTESVEAWLMAQGWQIGRTYSNDLHRHFGDGASAPIVLAVRR